MSCINSHIMLNIKIDLCLCMTQTLVISLALLLELHTPKGLSPTSFYLNKFSVCCGRWWWSSNGNWNSSGKISWWLVQSWSADGKTPYGRRYVVQRYPLEHRYSIIRFLQKTRTGFINSVQKFSHVFFFGCAVNAEGGWSADPLVADAENCQQTLH